MTDREKLAAEHRERERKETGYCPHCGTPGVWTYGGVELAWLGNGNAKLSEFSTTLRWDGTHEYSHDHTPERCIVVLKARVEKLGSVVSHVRAHLIDLNIRGDLERDLLMASTLAKLDKVIDQAPPVALKTDEGRTTG